MKFVIESKDQDRFEFFFPQAVQDPYTPTCVVIKAQSATVGVPAVKPLVKEYITMPECGNVHHVGKRPNFNESKNDATYPVSILTVRGASFPKDNFCYTRCTPLNQGTLGKNDFCWPQQKVPHSNGHGMYIPSPVHRCIAAQKVL